MTLTALALLLLPLMSSAAVATRPSDAVQVFAKGEGGYYCLKIPYLYRTSNGTLIALAEGRGRDGRQACDDFSVCVCLLHPARLLNAYISFAFVGYRSCFQKKF